MFLFGNRENTHGKRGASSRRSNHRNNRSAFQSRLRIEPLESRQLLSVTTYTVTNLSDSGTGSLREAIALANDHSGADIIAFSSSLSGTLTLTTGELSITDDVTIQGLGASTLTINRQAWRSRLCCR